MILSFKCKDTAALFDGRQVQKFVNIQAVAERKLQLLDAAETLEFLRSPPGNRLEVLSGKLSCMGGTAFASIFNGASASPGAMKGLNR